VPYIFYPVYVPGPVNVKTVSVPPTPVVTVGLPVVVPE
jgi:hypothetical protein